MATSALRLTEFSPGAGCACKLPAGDLARLMAPMAGLEHPDLLVGSDTSDDAAIWRVAPDRAVVLTADFLTPVVDDARTWGKVAAVNAVSDVYAMGGRPLAALNLVAWNVDDLGFPLLEEVLAGGAEAARECGFLVVGGHSIQDPHPTYGMAVIGEAHPDRLLTNDRLRSGDELVLTKAIGVGVITTGIKSGASEPDWVEAAVASMTRPNRDAAEVALSLGGRCATDVTGFGFLGHLRRLLDASGLGAEVRAGAVPLLPGARALAAAGVVPGGTRRNLEWVGPLLHVDESGPGAPDPVDVTLLADAQTSGGLILALPPDAAGQAVDRLRQLGHPAGVVGRAVDGEGITILP
ncbi:MAG TPA: selenide, water dikinase SelD [Acidimicrobiales bacterium]|nr:selenide, water dikinase SelD [Acidimicrobiales bacterium]